MMLPGELGAAPDREYPVLLLSSGQTFRVREVTLYDEQEVLEIAALRAEAMKSLGGVSTGIGFLGSPEWALGGAAALGLVEGLLSSAMRKQGIEALQKMQAKAEKLARSGRPFDASKLANSDTPDPQAWSATETAVIYIDDPLAAQRRDHFMKNSVARRLIAFEAQVEKVEKKVEKRFVHNGSEFVSIGTDAGTVKIRWSSVAAYYPPQPENVAS